MKAIRIKNPTVQFALPIVFETVFSTFLGLVVSSLVGGISGSSLTVISQGNMIVNLIVASLSMLTTGASVLCARMQGAGEYREASNVLEQALLLSTVFSSAITVLCLVFTVPILTLLMPNAEPAVMAEGVDYFRVLILSLPFLSVSSMLTSAQRVSGDSRSVMVVNTSTTLSLLLFGFLFLRMLTPSVTGAALMYLFARMVCLALALLAVIRSHRYRLQLRRILKPHFPTFKRIFYVGIPATFEAIFVQAGYLLAGSMVIGLGTFEAAVYNVANTLYSFASLPQSIFSPITLTTSGHLIGAKEYQKAQKNGWKLWGLGILSVLATSAILFALRYQLTPLYSADALVQTAAAGAIIWALSMNLPGVTLNTLIPQLNAGGAVKTNMVISLLGVWAVRLPLTYLFCYYWTLGANGVFLANTIALLFRTVCTVYVFMRGKYLYTRV